MSIYYKLCCNIQIVICNWHVQCYICDWMDEQINKETNKYFSVVDKWKEACYYDILFWLGDKGLAGC